MSDEVNQVLAELQKRRDNLFEALEKESDRGAVLVTAAFMDDGLERLLRAHMNSSSKKAAGIVDPLFDTFGPLSTFAAKIQLAYVLDLMQKWMYSDLQLIRKIRNMMAHSGALLSLESESIGSLVARLEGYERTKRGIASKQTLQSRNDKEAGSFAGSFRLRFQGSVTYTGALIYAKVVVQESSAPQESKARFMLDPGL